jgi:hypothetical protein
VGGAAGDGAEVERGATRAAVVPVRLNDGEIGANKNRRARAAASTRAAVEVARSGRGKHLGGGVGFGFDDEEPTRRSGPLQRLVMRSAGTPR